MENKKNTGWVWALVILAVIIIIVLVVRHNNAAAVPASATDSSVSTSTAMDSDDTALTATEDTSAGSIDAAVPSAALLSYADALAKYGTQRIQFDPSCQATPSHATWANGTDIMLDNRSASPRTLHLGSMGDVTVKAWGFKIVDFASTLLPNVITIDCDASQNVAQITIQS